MSDKLREAARKIKNRWRETSLGGCRVLSKGDDCDCTLCLVDNLLAAALADSATEDVPDCCSICAGTRKTLTGEPCICKTGTIYGELDALRRAVLDTPPEPTDEMVEALAIGISQVLSRYEDEGCDMQVPEFCAEWYEGFRNGLRAALAVQQKGEG